MELIIFVFHWPLIRLSDYSYKVQRKMGKKQPLLSEHIIYTVYRALQIKWADKYKFRKSQ